MKKNSNYLAAYYTDMQEMNLKKDMFLIPYYLSKSLNLPCLYYYGCNIGANPLPEEYRGVRMFDFRHEKLNLKNQFWDMFRCIIMHARSIKVFFTIKLSLPAMIITLLYKELNTQGKVMIMGDMKNPLAYSLVEHDFVFSTGIKRILKKILVNAFFRKIDIFSVEQKIVYQTLVGSFNKNKWKGLTICHPCLDDELFYSLGLERPTKETKDNIMLTVGRIGSYDKNTDMMLEAFAKVNFKDWKVILIGPFAYGFNTKETSDYTQKVDHFFESNPHLREHVIFTGHIYDSKQLYDYYIRSKVFLLTSRAEGFANVLSDAAALGCYIVSTDVGGASYVSNDWKFGTKLNQEDPDQLASVLTAIIDGNLSMDVSCQKSFNDLLWSNMIRKNVLPKLL